MMRQKPVSLRQERLSVATFRKPARYSASHADWTRHTAVHATV